MSPGRSQQSLVRTHDYPLPADDDSYDDLVARLWQMMARKLRWLDAERSYRVAEMWVEEACRRGYRQRAGPRSRADQVSDPGGLDSSGPSPKLRDPEGSDSDE